MDAEIEKGLKEILHNAVKRFADDLQQRGYSPVSVQRRKDTAGDFVRFVLGEPREYYDRRGPD